ncbi:3-phosphoinositide-dependent protein kinase 1 [Diplonema papillatum]|nr:3-phosphoinositide-dependent protein kinase 1 [Diplonema papillatum]
MLGTNGGPELDGLISPGLGVSVAPPPSTAASGGSAAGSNKGARKENFDWLEVLGRGSYSRVVLAVHKETQKKYAVKIVSKLQVINEKALLSCVKNERDILKMCNHPNIIKLVGTFTSQTELYYLMEYGGGELLDFIKKVGRFENHILRHISAEVINGLEYLHSKGVVHRDLKPENLLLDARNHVKFVDFGTAFVQTVDNPKPPQQTAMRDSVSAKNSVNFPGEGNHRGQTFCGTFQYISPELLDNGITTMASDLWAMGCIIFQMGAGHRPFDDGSVMLIFEKIRAPEKHLVFPPEFPPAAADVVRRLLVVDPQKRFGTPSMQGYPALKAHEFFEGINFETLPEQELNYLWKYTAPVWVSDDTVDTCRSCKAQFTFTNRRHHCRKCGDIFCNSCSSRQIGIPGLYQGKVRVCDDCYQTLKKSQLSAV